MPPAKSVRRPHLGSGSRSNAVGRGFPASLARGPLRRLVSNVSRRAHADLRLILALVRLAPASCFSSELRSEAGVCIGMVERIGSGAVALWRQRVKSWHVLVHLVGIRNAHVMHELVEHSSCLSRFVQARMERRTEAHSRTSPRSRPTVRELLLTTRLRGA